MNLNEEMKFEEHLKSIAERHEQVPSPEVWLNVRNAVLQKRSRRLTPLWIAGGLFLALLIGALSSEFILKPFGLHSDKQKMQPASENNINPSASNQNENKPTQPNSNLSLQSSATPSKNSFNLNHDSVIASRQKTSAIASAESKQATSDFYFQPKKITSSQPMVSDLNSEEATRNSIGESENSNGYNSISSDFAENNNSAFNQQTTTNSSLASLSEKRIFLYDPSKNPAQYREQKVGMILPEKSKPLNATIEADFIPLMNYSWNIFPLTKYEEVQSGDTLHFTRKPDTSSFHYSGFSSGVNFYYHLHSITFIGVGLHFTKLTTAIHYPIDGYSIYYPSTGTSEGTYQSGQVTAVTKWLDFSVNYGASLFPHSSNHLRLTGGLAFSHNLNVNTGNAEGLTSSLWWNGSTYEKTFSMAKNQLQLFTEAGYLHDFGQHMSTFFGADFHFYLLDLQAGKNITQHQLWLGLKLGIDYTIPAKK